MFDRLLERLNAPRDVASLAVFRMLFGLLMGVSALRFMSNGWVERFYGERTFFFKYWGFSFVEPGPIWAMYTVYVALALLGACIALGLFYRVAIVAFFVLFSYTELTDVTNYLNHYYLVSLLALLMSFMPLSSGWSLDALRAPQGPREQVPAWTLYVLRFQVAIVYFYAALAKTGSDWLVHAQPLNVWLSAQVDVPVLGPYLLSPSVALIASWGGFLHDLLVPPLLLWRRARPFAYAALLAFHALTSSWFNIGIFPVLMPIAATLFFDPSWPRRLVRWVSQPSQEHARAPLTSNVLGPAGAVALAGYCALQLALPLRSQLYGGNVLWHEQGMRFSWRVMLRAKQGSVSYRVGLRDGRELRVQPRRYLSTEQEREMAGQPDLVLQLAHHIARDFARRGQPGVSVRADALVSLNGRVPAAMIDPGVDLASVADGLALARFITPAPTTLPAALSPKAPYASVAP